ncbi:MAG: PQQ-binding-like beta-propeller repeat protein, partial [Thermoplasmata archaeon]|nr:PQQ-binding-like beta-propeller repeat protein [Thermoplasmata archaeon]
MRVDKKGKFIFAMGFAFLMITVFFLGNNAIENSVAVSNSMPPHTTIEYGLPYYEDSRGKWINSSTSIYINATDSDGINYTHYEIWGDYDNDGIFETLEKAKDVFDNSIDDNDATPNISIVLNISHSCFHRIHAYSVDKLGNVELTYGPLTKQWNYTFQPIVTHCWITQSAYAKHYKKMVFGSSPTVANLFDEIIGKEIVCGSDEVNNEYPELNYTKDGGIWRCWSTNGSIIWARATETDEARSSPAICDINNDGTPEIATGTTSGWNVEVMRYNGSFLWTFPAYRFKNGPFCWHSSPAVVDVIGGEDLEGKEVIIGNNPYHNVWCFDGDNSDGIDDGITLPRNTDGSSPYFPWKNGDLGVEGIDWDVIWIFNTSDSIIASPAVGDVDKDGYKEVVIGSLDGNIYCINASNGQLRWEYHTNASVFSSAAIANLDEDEQLEVVVGSNDSNLYCIDGLTGNLQWNYSTGGAIYSSPAIGDVDGDGMPEIVFGSFDGNISCLNKDGSLQWNYSTGGAIYSSPALASDRIASPEWPMFRHDCRRSGFYGNSTGEMLHVFIGSDDGYMYKLAGNNGSLISRFFTNGPIHTSPTVADIDGDVSLEILFYDWGGDNKYGWGGRDTFWCLEEPVSPKPDFVHVDNQPPITIKKVMSNDEYNVTADVDIWLNSTDAGNCSSGVKYIHYEIWWDSDKNGAVDTIVENETIYDNGSGDLNNGKGVISILIHLVKAGINEIRWYSVDNVGNMEAKHFQEHKVIVYAPHLTIEKQDSKDPVHPGDYFNYTITITNDGNENAYDVVVTESYDSHVTFISSNPNPSSGNNVWHLGTIQPYQTKTIEIKVRVAKPLPNIMLYNYVNVTCSNGCYN